MKIIVSVDKNWAIGKEGELLARIPDDMKRFRKITVGNVIVMGKTTFYSLPNKSPLDKRINIVLSRDKNFDDERVVICRSVEETLEEIKKYEGKETYIIGGEQIYRQFLNYCSEALITKFDDEYDADKYFPNLDENNDWVIAYEGEELTYESTRYRYVTYKNINMGCDTNE